MSPNQADRIKEIFGNAAELEGTERASYLDHACAGDTALRTEVERLLAALDSGDNLLGRTSVGQLLFGAAPEASTFRAGDLLGTSFRIVRLIGTGGMGEVYEAEDLRLGGRVAIKTLRSRYVNQPEFAARFRREIQLARRVTHPNVCRIFDLGRDRVRDEDVLYLSMELLEGETLKARLQHGALPVAEVHEIVSQIAEGLAALHAAAVIHRDVKPANVLLVGSGTTAARVVITDFGLAHHILSESGEESLSTTGQILGTPAYAAPEQLTGKKVGPEADIYSLGLVMYEMLCGRRPFEGDTPLESAARKLTITVDPPGKYAQLDSRWNTLVLGCLERDPAKRIHSIAEVLEALRALEDEQQPQVIAEAGPVRRRPLLRRAIFLGALALAALLPIQYTALGAPLRRRACEGLPGSPLFCELPPVKDIAIFPFISKGATAADRALASGWAHFIRENFHRMAPDPAKMCVHLRNDQLAEGVRLVLEGETEARGNSLTFRFSIRENRTAARGKFLVLRRVALTVPLESADALYSGPLTALATALDVKYAEPEWSAWKQAGPKHGDSAVAHFTGLGYLADGKYEPAAESFSTVLDPTRDFGFAAAQVGLGDAYRLLYNTTRDSIWELRARRAYERALPLDRDYGFGGAERGLGELDFAAGKNEDAIGHYRAAIEFWPFDHPLQKSLVAAYEAAGRLEDAEAVLRAGAKRAPRCWQPYNALGSLFSRHGRPREAENSFLELIRLSPDNGSAYHNLAFDYIKMGRYDDAVYMASKSLEVRPYPMAYSTLGRAYLYRGCVNDALINVQKSVDLDPGYHILWSTLADVLEVSSPASPQARDAAARSIALSREVLDKTPGDAVTRARYALNLARTGDRPGAIREAGLAVKQSPDNQHVLLSAAEALERAGDRTAALAIVERALRSGLAVPEVEASHGLALLRQDSKFGNLLRRLHLKPSADPGELTPKRAAGCPAWTVPGKGFKTASF